jgi:cell wall-associated NlpC family hydrolase
MTRPNRAFLAVVGAALLALPATPAHAAVPDWVDSAVTWAAKGGYLERADFHANKSMTRTAFGDLMVDVFGTEDSKKRGAVTAGEVDAALVKALGFGDLARSLEAATSPDGWDPEVAKRFGTEVVARELGLRYNRSTSEEKYEAGAGEPLRQADIVWALWQAKTSPDTYSAAVLESFSLPDYSRTQKKVVKYALSQVGEPYIWGGEWDSATPTGYAYGAQPAGGFDCSGFSWYVLREAAGSWAPKGRSYDGWSLPERSSSDMAAATPKNKRLSYKQLRPGDLLLFAADGRDSKASAVYHAGVYIGKGWMVHSSGSRDGVSIGRVGAGSWWRTQLAWGRRVIKT